MNILLDLFYLFAAIFVAFVLYPLWINFVYRFQMGEDIRGDGPKSHLAKKGTPTMGGFVFIFTVSFVTLILNRSRTQTVLPILVVSVAGLLGIIEDFTKVYKRSGLTGFVEHHFGNLFNAFSKSKDAVVSIETTAQRPRGKLLNPWSLFKEFWRVVGSSSESGGETHQKFLFQAVLGGFVSYWVYFKLGWDFLWLPLVGNVHIGFAYPLFIFVLFIIVLNAVAFTDGLDGLLGGLSLFAFIAFWAIARVLEYNSLAGFCATFAGALIPFLYFNVYPARIFMGNVGSHALGAALAILSIVMHREIALFVICAVMLFDGFTSPLQQLSVKFTGKRIFLMAPFHHHFELLGWPETKVTLRFWLFGILFAFIGIFIAIL
jgi:phospho-N-acetylmuramoyl-pentapeptide-transferase